MNPKYLSRFGIGIIIALLFIMYVILFGGTAHGAEEVVTAPAVPGLKEQATQALQSLLSAATQTGEFLKEQIPIALRELLTYYTATYALTAVLGLAAAALGGIYAPKLGAKFTAQYKEYMARSGCMDSGDRYIFFSVVLYMAAVAGAGVATSFLFLLLKITLAPRIWLIEYAANLVK